MFACNLKMSGESADPDCFCKDQKGLILQANNVQKQITGEKVSADILGLYKQMKLQEVIQNTPYLDENIKKNMMYTNGRLMNETALLIDEANVDFPKTFGNLTNDQNTNTILDAIQNRSKHLNASAFNTK